jgi:hypothetical protein
MNSHIIRAVLRTYLPPRPIPREKCELQKKKLCRSLTLPIMTGAFLPAGEVCGPSQVVVENASCYHSMLRIWCCPCIIDITHPYPLSSPFDDSRFDSQYSWALNNWCLFLENNEATIVSVHTTGNPRHGFCSPPLFGTRPPSAQFVPASSFTPTFPSHLSATSINSVSAAECKYRGSGV